LHRPDIPENGENSLQETQETPPGIAQTNGGEEFTQQHPDPGNISRLLLFLIILFMAVSTFIPFPLGGFLVQWVIILLPALWYWKRCRLAPVSFARLKPLEPRFIPTVLALAFGFWTVTVMLSGMIFIVMALFGYEPMELLPVPETSGEYLILFLLVVVSAGFCEEVLFRGTVMPSLEKYGLIPAIFFSALLFALFHLNFMQFISSFILGTVIALVVIKTGSLWAGVLFHMVNNFLALANMYLVTALEEYMYQSMVFEMLFGMLYLLIIALGVIAAVLGVFFLLRQAPVPRLWGGSFRLLPPGWFNWAFILIVFFFLGMVVLELAVGFGIIEAVAW